MAALQPCKKKKNYKTLLPPRRKAAKAAKFSSWQPSPVGWQCWPPIRTSAAGHQKFDVEERRRKPGLEAGFNAAFSEILHQFYAGYSTFLALNRIER